MGGGGWNPVAAVTKAWDDATTSIRTDIEKSSKKISDYTTGLASDPGRLRTAIGTLGGSEIWREGGKEMMNVAKANMPGGPSQAPEVPTVPPPPSPTDESTGADMAEARRLERQRSTRGRASTILTGNREQGRANTARRTLLGT